MDQPLCANGCGFYGSSANKNLCSKCYKEYLKENMTKSYDDECETKNLKVKIFVPHESSSTSKKHHDFDDKSTTDDVGAAIDAVAVSKSVKNKNRCKSCNKKVGITGFECRCGEVFCGRHRYPELHACNVNFKEIGRQALAKQNPLCIHDKLASRV